MMHNIQFVLFCLLFITTGTFAAPAALPPYLDILANTKSHSSSSDPPVPTNGVNLVLNAVESSRYGSLYLKFSEAIRSQATDNYQS